MAVLVLGLSGVARAFTFQVLDPSGPQGSFPSVNISGPNPFSFYDCTSVVTGDGCFGFVNNTTLDITSFTATITADVPITNASCPTTGQAGNPNAFSVVDTCSASGDTITVALSGSPGILPGTLIWIVETGLPDSDFGPDAGTFSVTAAATPEPGSIWMLLSGTGALGYVVRRRRVV
jgi:hypothetical protein